jgi:hypothetical protein
MLPASRRDQTAQGLCRSSTRPRQFRVSTLLQKRGSHNRIQMPSWGVGGSRADLDICRKAVFPSQGYFDLYNGFTEIKLYCSEVWGRWVGLAMILRLCFCVAFSRACLSDGRFLPATRDSGRPGILRPARHSPQDATVELTRWKAGNIESGNPQSSFSDIRYGERTFIRVPVSGAIYLNIKRSFHRPGRFRPIWKNNTSKEIMRQALCGRS